jgi:hypothetical protein
MASKTKKVETEAPKPGEVQVNFGNVEALKLQMMNEINKNIKVGVALLSKIDATLIRMESKYDENQKGSE